MNVGAGGCQDGGGVSIECCFPDMAWLLHLKLTAAVTAYKDQAHQHCSMDGEGSYESPLLPEELQVVNDFQGRGVIVLSGKLLFLEVITSTHVHADNPNQMQWDLSLPTSDPYLPIDMKAGGSFLGRKKDSVEEGGDNKRE